MFYGGAALLGWPPYHAYRRPLLLLLCTAASSCYMLPPLETALTSKLSASVQLKDERLSPDEQIASEQVELAQHQGAPLQLATSRVRVL
jgi:hypothetical protein